MKKKKKKCFSWNQHFRFCDVCDIKINGFVAMYSLLIRELSIFFFFFLFLNRWYYNVCSLALGFGNKGYWSMFCLLRVNKPCLPLHKGSNFEKDLFQIAFSVDFFFYLFLFLCFSLHLFRSKLFLRSTLGICSCVKFIKIF